MLELGELLRKYFRIDPGDDNLPILAKPLTGRETGRHQLAKMMGAMGLSTGIEIGVGQGFSAKLWCEAMPNLALIGIDPYIGGMSRTQRHQDKYYAQAQTYEKRFDFAIWKMTSMEAVDRFADHSVDFVHIDGNHRFDFVMQDIIRYVPKVRPGGLVLIHDYCAFKLGGVLKAVDGYTHCHHIEPWYVTQDCNPTAFWARGAEHA